MSRERIDPKGRRNSARSKRLAGGTELQVKHWPKDVTSVQIQMERTDNDSQERNGLKERGWESLPQTVLICQSADTRL